MIDFETSPARYRHWKLRIEPPIAFLCMDVDEDAPLVPGYELKLNSYDLGVDIELYDAITRLRFEHPEVGAVILTSAKDKVFCAGANIRMLGSSSHAHKVNFCKFTNETRCAIEEASAESGQPYIAMINGAASGGGYELALATDHILLTDDGASNVSLPEVPLLAVLPGTGGLTRLVDKRKVRRDRADFFCTTAEGMRGKRALEWGLIDELARPSELLDAARARALALAERSSRPRDATGIALPALNMTPTETRIDLPHLGIEIDGQAGVAAFTIQGPDTPPPATPDAMTELGAVFWPLALARAIDHAILHLRTNRPEIGCWVLKTHGDSEKVAAYDAFLAANQDHWLAREVRLYLKRALKRFDVSSRSLIALIEPGSCFAGTLFELALAADRSYMLDGDAEEGPAPHVLLTEMNFGLLPMPNGLSRLETRFLDDDQAVGAARAAVGKPLDAAEADGLGLVTFTPDDIDWQDEVRLAVEERAAYSGDALTGMEANLRFAGPETLETKIFGRLTAWQNWIFQRPSATGEEGALKLYGTGRRGVYDKERV